MRTAVLSAAAALAVLLAALTAPTPATAHTQLAGSTPQPGTTVQQLDEIRLQFHAPLRPGGRHAIRLLGPDGARWDDARTRTIFDRELLVGVGAAPALPKQGEYTVRWCALPVDGHPQSGAYKFSYSGPTSASARPPTPNPGASSACATAARDGAWLTGWLLVGVVAGSVLFVAAAAIHTRRARPGRGR